MVIALSPDERFEYVLQSEKALSSVPTDWQFRVATRRVVETLPMDPALCGGPLAQGVKFLETLLVGWRNFMGPTGQEIPFSLETIRQLPDLLRASDFNDLVGASLRSVSLTETDRKNSESAPSL